MQKLECILVCKGTNFITCEHKYMPWLQVRSKLVASDTSAKSKDTEISRLARLVESMRASEADFAERASTAEQECQKLAADVAAGKQRIVHVEAQLSSHQHDVLKQKEAAGKVASQLTDTQSELVEANDEIKR